MIRSDFRILKIDLSSGKGKYEDVEGRDTVAGGSGLAALLFSIYGHADKPWDDPDQPIIFVIGPLTGYFPLMSKTVCAFKSPYHNQYTESHGGGRSALALRFADVDGLVITGRANRLSCLSISSGHFEITDAHFMRGMDVFRTGRMLRHRQFGHRNILRIGPAGTWSSNRACINADTYRHFGRLGGGGVIGQKRRPLLFIGDKVFDLPEGDDYGKLYREVYRKMLTLIFMAHDLGTPANVASLNEIRALPIRNLLQDTDPEMAGITGERFASDTLLRNHACSGCPVLDASTAWAMCVNGSRRKISISISGLLRSASPCSQLAPCWVSRTALPSWGSSMQWKRLAGSTFFDEVCLAWSCGD